MLSKELERVAGLMRAKAEENPWRPKVLERIIKTKYFYSFNHYMPLESPDKIINYTVGVFYTSRL